MLAKLGALLLEEVMVTPQQLQEALAHQRMNGEKLSKALVTLGYLKDEEITSLLSRRYGVPAIDLSDFEVDAAVLRIVPAEIARKYGVLPLSVMRATLTVAMADPANVGALDDLEFMTGYHIEPVVASETGVDKAIERYYGQGSLRLPETPNPTKGPPWEVRGAPSLTADDLSSVGLSAVDLGLGSWTDLVPEDRAATFREEVDLASRDTSGPGAVGRLTNVILVDALKRGASDIHIEPYRSEFRVRYRIDGVLFNAMALPLRLREPLASHVRTLARLDRADKRLFQAGRIAIRMKLEDRSRDLDCRVSCLPTRWGETIVLHLIDPSNLVRDPSQLGLDAQPLAQLTAAIEGRRGLVVFTGPVGSGKTTMLYSALDALSERGLNIVTLEDHAAGSLPGINQITLRSDLGFDRQVALGAGLRQAPNVLAVDPVVDDETSESLVRLAARSGLLVLGTLLETDAPAAIETLARQSARSSDLARALSAVVAQRVVRRICESCREETSEISQDLLVALDVDPQEREGFKAYQGKGCPSCNGSGYRGRVRLCEILKATDALRELVWVGAAGKDIRRNARENGALTLRRSGLEKVRAGLTTIGEVLCHTER